MSMSSIRSGYIISKYKEDGTIDSYKAQLVANAFTPVPNVNFDATFNTIIKAKTIHLIHVISVVRCLQHFSS